MIKLLTARKHWIFDMDGTLTLAIHDFDAIRAELGLPEGRPILESLASLPHEQAQRLNRQLDAIELEIAHDSRAASGASELLQGLSEKGCNLGILTRNNRINIQATLSASGLDRYFTQENWVSRDCTPPKPDPAGINLLLARWDANPHQAVMVGDHLFDINTGIAANTATVHVDRSGEFPHKEQATVCVQELDELLVCL